MIQPTKHYSIDILVEEESFEQFLNEGEWMLFFEDVLNKTFSYLNYTVPEIGLSILLTHDEKMKTLNKQFREKDASTNVLSFPSDEFDENNGGLLGDLAFGFGVIKSEHTHFMNHMTHLTIHGILHLLSFDHEDDEQAEVMENHEINILKIFNIDNPYRDL